MTRSPARAMAPMAIFLPTSLASTLALSTNSSTFRARSSRVCSISATVCAVSVPMLGSSLRDFSLPAAERSDGLDVFGHVELRQLGGDGGCELLLGEQRCEYGKG